MGVDHSHSIGVDQFHPRDGDAHLDDLNRGEHRCLDAGERAGGRRHGFGQGVELDGDFGDDAQGAFAAHHQTGEVVAGRRFASAGSGAYDFTAGGDHFQAQHVFAHGAVAHRIRAAGAGGAHAANRGVSPWVNGEKQACAFDFFIQLFAGDAGLHRDRQVFGVDGQHFIHTTQVDADAALHCQQVALQ